MAEASILPGTPQTLACSLAGLASSATLGTGWQSAVIDFKDLPWASGGKGIDLHVGGIITLGTSPTANRSILIAAFASWDDATFTGGLGAGNSAATPDDLSLLSILEVINTVGTTNKVYRWGPYSLAGIRRYAGIAPTQVGLYFAHDTGVALNATAGNHEVKWTPYRMQSA